MANGTHVRPGGTAVYNPESTDTDITGFTTEVGKLTIQNGSGDYNSNGVVDAADYVLWRKNPGGFGGTPAGYDAWRAKFGSSAASKLDMSAGSVFEWELGALSTSDPGVNFDQVVVGGNLVLGGTSSLNLDFTLPSLAAADPNAGDPFWNSPHSWKIIDTTTNTGSTNFASITNGTWSLGHFTTTVGAGADAGDIFLNYLVPGSGSALGTAAVPEPAIWMLAAFGALGSLLFRTRSFSWGLSHGAAAQTPFHMKTR